MMSSRTKFFEHVRTCDFNEKLHEIYDPHYGSFVQKYRSFMGEVVGSCVDMKSDEAKREDANEVSMVMSPIFVTFMFECLGFERKFLDGASQYTIRGAQNVESAIQCVKMQVSLHQIETWGRIIYLGMQEQVQHIPLQQIYAN